MNQRAYFSIDTDVETRSYRLYLPVGASWGEAVEVTRQMLNKVQELAELASQKQQEQEQEQQEQSNEPIQDIVQSVDVEIQEPAQGEDNGSQE